MRPTHRYRFVAVVTTLAVAAGLVYANAGDSAVAQRPRPEAFTKVAQQPESGAPAASAEGTTALNALKTEVATFAAGCFWCVEADFDQLPGVLKTTPGYTGGHFKNPTYELVATGLTGHTEALQVVYDPTKVNYEKLLSWYWRHADPTDAYGQFCDRGNEYRPAIFVHTPEQRKLAEASKEELDKSGVLDRPIVVKIVDASTFTPAEPEHHDFYLTHPWRYMLYRHGCGRDQRLLRVWRKAIQPSG